MSTIKELTIENLTTSTSISESIGADAQNIDVARNSSGDITDVAHQNTSETLDVTLNNIEDKLSDVQYNFIGTLAEWEALTDEEKAKYDTYDIIDEYNTTPIDDSFSDSSSNPVQNRIIKATLDNIGEGVKELTEEGNHQWRSVNNANGQVTYSEADMLRLQGGVADGVFLILCHSSIIMISANASGTITTLAVFGDSSIYGGLEVAVANEKFYMKYTGYRGYKVVYSNGDLSKFRYGTIAPSGITFTPIVAP